MTRRFSGMVLTAALGAFVFGGAAASTAAAGSSGPDKQAVCHRESDGTFRLLTVGITAVPAHMVHGDGQPGGPGSGGMVFDEACALVTPPPPPDADSDGVPDEDDNCPNIANATQLDGDSDGIGDPCEVPDNYEDNNSAETAPNLGSLSTEDLVSVVATFHDFSVDTRDFYRFRVQEPTAGCFPSESQPYTVNAHLNVPPGQDYDLFLYAVGNPTVLASSTNGTGLDDHISFTFDGECGEDDSRDFLIEVHWWSGAATQSSYSLQIWFEAGSDDE